MKRLLASIYCLVAIAAASWMLLYSAVHDMVDASSVDLRAFVEPIKLLVPTVVFVLCSWGYIRTRRAIDKETRGSREAEALLNHAAWVMAATINNIVNTHENGKYIVFNAANNPRFEDLRQAYREYIESGGDPFRIPENFVRSITCAPEDPVRSTILS